MNHFLVIGYDEFDYYYRQEHILNNLIKPNCISNIRKTVVILKRISVKKGNL